VLHRNHGGLKNKKKWDRKGEGTVGQSAMSGKENGVNFPRLAKRGVHQGRGEGGGVLS